MWTPKRVLLMVLGLGLFVSGYAGYARQLGGVDGLPPLPEQYWPTPGRGNVDPPSNKPAPAVIKKLEMAFGRDCPEMKRAIKIEVPARGIVLASKEFFIEPDGRVRLVPLSVALFGKARGEDGTPEINTVRSDLAYLTFERPIQTVADMGKHRITAAQIAGNIRIVNNRRTLARDDDLSVDISKGPLYYDQKLQKIWSDDFVHIEDLQSKPRPTQVTGQGVVLDLLVEQLQGKDKQPRQRSRQVDSIAGVRSALLKGAVDMHLFVDGKSGFLSGPAKEADKGGKEAKTPPADPKKPPEKAHLIIKTQGPFRYDLEKEFATFDIPPPREGKASPFPEHVVATRVHDALGKLDQLVCERLELQFRKKESPAQNKPGAGPAKPPPPKKADSGGGGDLNLEIQWAHAKGKSVILVSDAEMLEAHGNDFFYDARTAATTLTGKPMWAIKEGNEIQAQQLLITNNGKGAQTARAKGPGTLSLFDKATGKRPTKARWDDLLTSSRDGDYDLIHLTGRASFVDDENKQELHAEDLRIWLWPQEKKPEAGTPASGAPGKAGAPAEDQKGASRTSRKPHHLIATRNVRTVSKEFNIKQAERFVIWFEDAPPAAAVVGQAADGKTAPAPASGVPAKGPAEPARPGQPPPKKEEEKSRPIDLWAWTVEAHVLRVADKNQLQKMHCEAPPIKNGPPGVHVVQAPAKPGEKGVDIQGDVLDLTAQPEGNFLVVKGDLARLDMDKMLVLGPEVNIDQASNKAWVNGIGAMTIESDQDFQGNKLKRPTPLTIHWNRAMVFSGQNAVFHGGIQADQENARLTCQELQVFFDKPISLKEGQKDKEKAKVRNLVCDKAAAVEDSVFENGKEVKYQRVTGTEIVYENEDGVMQASGPGEVRLMQKGGAEGGFEAPGAPRPEVRKAPPRPGEKKDEEMKLTYISFHEKMTANKKKNLAIFRSNVRVLHMPGDNPRVDIDLDRVLGRQAMPAGAMYLRSDHLKVYTRPNAAGTRSWQTMEATGRVQVFSPEFSGQAERVSYDEEKDQVIFDGGQSGIATLWKVDKQGEPPQRIDGRKIIYARRTSKYTVENAGGLTGH